MTTTTDRPTATGTAEPSGRAALAGTGTLIRFVLRRDRVRIPVWIVALTISTVSTAAGFPDLYKTAADRQSRAELMDSPAATAMSGPGFGLDDYTFGAMLSNEMLGFVAIFVALMSVLLVTRHTRAEEESGRAELVRANVVGRHAHSAAALTVVIGTNLLLGALIAASLAGSGIESIDGVGSAAFGFGLAGVGIVFTGIALVAAQITENTRGASGMGAAAIGVAFVLRAVGDIGSGALSWLSPIGWAQRMRPYVDERWWPLALMLVVGGALIVTALVLSTRRDVGLGLRHQRPGPASAKPSLGTPLGLAFRLQRANLIGWCIGLFLFGAMYGSILSDVEEFVSDNEAVRDMVSNIGGETAIDSFLTLIISMLAIVSTIYGILAVQRLRGEETTGRAEPVLATAVPRARLAGGHVTVALAGGALVLLAGGAGLAISGGASTGDAGITGDIIAAVLVNIPALWISTGLAVALFGLAPRALAFAWAVLVYALVVSMLGGLLQFPDWMSNLSPFGHVPGIPAEEFTITPVVVLTAITAGLVWTGIDAFRRRDLTTN
ncbi:ABC-2 type transport system permease protein [Haloactinopolyspora alba]|uniref:ABC-2 type transport system permease protein n=1 Tax=Haloactinopolyspora alba TaxID=648780 RepID=A0A2P8E7B6_9ACTN|nr:ABC transporter permease [Haloactinopolyspora alba]PSL05359.1 ABC-2 type transport system permease protein [Haloactinopolyspora alba]